MEEHEKDLLGNNLFNALFIDRNNFKQHFDLNKCAFYIRN